MTKYQYDIGYGKHQIPVYRVNATPLTEIRPIPESAFTGRTNTIFAMLVDVEVLGDHFLPAYTAGRQQHGCRHRQHEELRAPAGPGV